MQTGENPNVIGVAARDACSFLKERMGFDQWLVTRRGGEHLTILHGEGGDNGLSEGTVVPWGDTLCSHMVTGRGPRIAPTTAAVPAYT